MPTQCWPRCKRRRMSRWRNSRGRSPTLISCGSIPARRGRFYGAGGTRTGVRWRMLPSRSGRMWSGGAGRGSRISSLWPPPGWCSWMRRGRPRRWPGGTVGNPAGSVAGLRCRTHIGRRLPSLGRSASNGVTTPIDFHILQEESLAQQWLASAVVPAPLPLVMRQRRKDASATRGLASTVFGREVQDSCV